MTTPCNLEETKLKSSVSTRLFSLAALCGALGAIGYVANTIYHVANDGFVAPIILSPDSDMVIQSKLSMSQLLAEKMRIVSKKEAIEAELVGAEQALEQLKTLRDASAKALEWTTSITATQAAAGVEDQRTLVHQRMMLSQMIADEESFVERMKKDMEAGLVAKADYARELHALNQMRVTALENDRAHILSGTQLSQVRLTQQAIEGSSGRPRISTPEMLVQQDQMVRVQCETIRLEAERRSKLAERRNLDEELGKLEELLAQLKTRPIFRAIEANTNVAFVPYTQIEGVRSGAEIYDCIWGVFACKSVGRIAELLPGEAIVQDPWGSPARGQYAILSLNESQAAQSKTLRVRPSGQRLAPATPQAGPRLAKNDPRVPSTEPNHEK
jgi:hypothetical protein